MGRFVANSRRGKMKTILALALAALAAAEPEAKPEADAYYGYGYGLGGYYGGYRTYGLGYGYGHGLYYGKREAEAEPYSSYAPVSPLRLSLHRWHCSRRHPRCRRCLRRCWTLRCQLRWNRPCCQEGGRG